MSEKPPPIPLKYRMAGSAQPPTPARVSIPAPRRPQVSRREALFRIVIVLVILVSGAVAYWSFFHRFLPLQRQARSTVTKVSSLSAQVDQLERRWAPGQVEEIRTRYREVYRQLFADQRALEEWLGQLQTQAAALALDINVGFGAGLPQDMFPTNVAVIPASISLEVLPSPGEASGKTPYERVLLFGQQLAAHGKRADLAELTVTGGAGSISRALMVFNLWAGDLGTETAAPTTAAHHNPQ